MKRKLSALLTAVMIVNLVLPTAFNSYADTDVTAQIFEEAEFVEAEEYFEENNAEENETVEAEEAETEEIEFFEEVSDDTDGQQEEACDCAECHDECCDGDCAVCVDEEETAEAEERIATPSEAAIPVETATPSEARKEASERIILSATAEDGVTVVLEADPGVFPEGVELSASIVEEEDAKEAEGSIREKKEESIAKRTTYDICVLLGGIEVEPDTSKGNVRVSFIIPDVPASADNANIYHHTEDGAEVVLKEEIAVPVNEEEACEEEEQEEEEEYSEQETEEELTAEAVIEEIVAGDDSLVVLTTEVDSFSFYTIDFTYESKTVTVSSTIPAVLSEVLAMEGINGTISNAAMNDAADGYVSVYKDGDIWMIASEQEFKATFELTVTFSDSSSRKLDVKSSQGVSATIRNYTDHSTTGLRNSSLLEVYTEGFASNATLEYTYNATATGDSKYGLEIYKNSDLSDTSTKKAVTKGSFPVSYENYKYFAVQPQYGKTQYEYAKLTVTVTVKDTNSKSSTYGKTAKATKVGFEPANLAADVLNMNFIMFVGENKVIKNMYGLSGITHIVCDYSYTTVDDMTNDAYIQITKSGSGTSAVYSLNAKKVGQSVFTANVKKSSSCSFHSGQDSDVTTKVLVVNQPSYSYDGEKGTLTVSNLTPGLTYTINGEDKTAPETVDNTSKLVFSGIKPRSEYVVTLSEENGTDTFKREASVTTGAGHLHHLTYSASGATITATCDGGEGDACPMKSDTITISASDAACDGTAKTASLNKTTIGDYTPVIHYEGTGTTVYADTTTAPAAEGTYKASITAGPEGNEVTASVEFKITKKAKTVVNIPAKITRNYTGSEQISDFADGEQYTVKSQAKGTDAGTYNAVLTLKDTENYTWKDLTTADANAVFEIVKASSNTITPGNVPADKTYDGTAVSAATATATFGTVKIKYVGVDGTSYESTTPPTEPGCYKVVAWVEGNDNYPDVAETKIGTFTISKVVVNVPEKITKPYTGVEQTSDFAEGVQYTVKSQAKGTEAGVYYAVLTLKDSSHYTWNGSASVDANAVFEITKASKNTITASSVPADKTYDGNAITAATATSTFGTVKIKYVGVSGTSYESTTPPTGAGQYIVIAKVDGTDNYEAAAETQIGTFTISKATVTVPEGKQTPYTGTERTSDFADGGQYTVKSQAKGTNVGTYQATLELKDAANYSWTNNANAIQNVDFEITKVHNNVSGVTMADSTYGTAPSDPTSSALFGTAQYTYEKYDADTEEWIALDGKPGKFADAGTYRVTAEVEETSNYFGASDSTEFVIAPAVVEEPEIAAKVYTGFAQKAYFDEEAFVENGRSVIIADSNTGWVGERDSEGHFPFYLELDGNHVWKGTGTSKAVLIFIITPDPMNEKTPEQKADGETYTSGRATVKVYTRKMEGAPVTYIDNMNLALAYSLLSDEEKAAYDNGDDIAIDIRLEVRPKDEEEVPEDDEELIMKEVKAMKNGRLGIYLDLTLWKDVSIDNGPVNTKQLHETEPATICVSVEIPEELRKENRSYRIARAHLNTGATLPTEEIKEKNGSLEPSQQGSGKESVMKNMTTQLGFTTDKFSTYAIIFADPVPAEDTIGAVSRWWNSTDKGWVKNAQTGKWYVVRDNELVKGWYLDDEDGYWYYLDPNTGEMHEGWVEINGRWYYFTTIDEVPETTWFFGREGDGKWHYYGSRAFRPHGAMYRNETTPNGHFVDDTGAMVK